MAREWVSCGLNLGLCGCPVQAEWPEQHLWAAEQNTPTHTQWRDGRASETLPCCQNSWRAYLERKSWEKGFYAHKAVRAYSTGVFILSVGGPGGVRVPSNPASCIMAIPFWNLVSVPCKPSFGLSIHIQDQTQSPWPSTRLLLQGAAGLVIIIVSSASASCAWI